MRPELWISLLFPDSLTHNTDKHAKKKKIRFLIVWHLLSVPIVWLYHKGLSTGKSYWSNGCLGRSRYFWVSQFSMEQMDQKHKVCVHYGILNASLSTDREEDNYLPSAQRVERSLWKGWCCSQAPSGSSCGELLRERNLPAEWKCHIQFIGALVCWVLNCVNEKLETHSNE